MALVSFCGYGVQLPIARERGYLNDDAMSELPVFANDSEGQPSGQRGCCDTQAPALSRVQS